MKITDLTCATLGHTLIVRVATDEGISGYGEIEAYKVYLKPQVLHYTLSWPLSVFVKVKLALPRFGWSPQDVVNPPSFQ